MLYLDGVSLLSMVPVILYCDNNPPTYSCTCTPPKVVFPLGLIRGLCFLWDSLEIVFPLGSLVRGFCFLQDSPFYGHLTYSRVSLTIHLEVY